MSFDRWMEQVNELCIGAYAMSIYDLPDMDFYYAFEDGQSPEEFMAEVLPDVDALEELVLS